MVGLKGFCVVVLYYVQVNFICTTRSKLNILTGKFVSLVLRIFFLLTFGFKSYNYDNWRTWLHLCYLFSRAQMLDLSGLWGGGRSCTIAPNLLALLLEVSRRKGMCCHGFYSASGPKKPA